MRPGSLRLEVGHCTAIYACRSSPQPWRGVSPSSPSGSAASIDGSAGPTGKLQQVAALALWSGAAWVLLTWKATVEQIAYGVAVSLAVAVILAPLGPVALPWRLLRPDRLWRLAALLATSAGRIVGANLVLARRVWSPSRPIRTGMLVVPTELTSSGTVTAVGLLGSIIVDHQLVDLEAGRLQYHAVWVASEDPSEARERINGPVERLLLPIDEEQR